VKVLFLSGHDICVESPFLQKPFTPESLAKKVRAVLDSRREAAGVTEAEPVAAT
jgi:hypothetical protein